MLSFCWRCFEFAGHPQKLSGDLPLTASERDVFPEDKKGCVVSLTSLWFVKIENSCAEEVAL